MYILTKRSAPNEHGQIQQHSIHGHTSLVTAARTWFRAAYSTDVVEVPDERMAEMVEPGWEHNENISTKRFPSWREQQLSAEKARP